MENTLSTRIDELEIRNVYLERNMEELSAHIFEQQQKIERMDVLLKQMTKRLLELAPGNNSLPENERPPHY